MMNNQEDKNRICLIVPSLKAGGMERVMAELANYLAQDSSFEIHLVLLSKRENFFPVEENVIIHRPAANPKNKLTMMLVYGRFIRSCLKTIKPKMVISFGSMYNSFVLLYSLGLKTKIYVSDRSNPYRNTKLKIRKDPIERHDGILHYFLKKYLYRNAAGILVQTEKAREIEFNYSGHNNIILFPNPVRDIEDFPAEKKEKWIINVGRFIPTKNQELLIEIFSKIRFDDWKLVFAGEGPGLNNAKKKVSDLNLEEHVLFLGNVTDIDRYLRKSEIFAFPSISEGFPNALAEGMKASLACVAYDCVAGPSDLIRDGENGFLVEPENSELFQLRLMELMRDDKIRTKFQQVAETSMDKFNREVVIEKLKKELVAK